MGVIFGLFETGMPILGLLLGHSLAGRSPGPAHWIGAALLIATGTYALVQAVGRRRALRYRPAALAGPASTTGRLLVTGLALRIASWPSASSWARTTSSWSSPRS